MELLDYLFIALMSIIGVLHFIDFKKGENITWSHYWIMYAIAMLQIFRNTVLLLGL